MLAPRPSAAHRWLKCAGSVALAETCRREDPSAIASRGNKLHGQACEAIAADPTDELPREIAGYVARCRELRGLASACGAEAFLQSELISGTVDFWALVDGTCHILDLKTGFIEVEAEDNAQLHCYALILRHLLRHVKVDRFVLEIWQNGQMRQEQANEQLLDLITFKIAKIKAGYMQFKTGNWCMYCPCAGVCPAVRIAHHSRMGLELPDVTPEMYEAAKVASAWSETIIAKAKQLAESGELPGYEIRTRNGPFTWTREAETELQKRLTVEEILLISKLASPSAAIKEAPQLADLVNSLSVRTTQRLIVPVKPDSTFEVTK